MTWYYISYNGVRSVAFVFWLNELTSNSNVLESHLLPNVDLLASKKKMKFYKNNTLLDAKSLKWPANSPDLNTSKNLWGDLTRICGNRKQFTSSVELEFTIKYGWYKTDLELCQKVVSSVKTILFEEM